MQELFMKEINYDDWFKHMLRKEEITEEEKEKDREAAEIMQKKILEAEKSLTYIEFMNRHTEKLLTHTSSEVLTELSLRL